MEKRTPQEIMEELKQFDTPTITNVVATYASNKEFCLGLYDAWQSSCSYQSGFEMYVSRVGKDR